MDNIHLHILSPNKYLKRYFGVDYFMNLLTGSNPLFKYYSTSLDANPVYKPGPISFLEEKYGFLEEELKTKAKGSIIGVQNNPDIYEGLDSLEKIINLLDEYDMGLYLETSSLKILEDLDLLVAYSNKHPLLIGIPCSTYKLNSKLFNDNLKVSHAAKLIQKLTDKGINAGMVIKPIIPRVNDSLVDFLNILDSAFQANTTFIYLSASVKFDSKKIKAFYDIIDLEFPENMIYYHEEYGYKSAWESKELSILKKNFVILCKKNKVLYSMKDIINLYKPDLNIQLKLF